MRRRRWLGNRLGRTAVDLDVDDHVDILGDHDDG
jgi:hypothetical protein